MWNSNYLVITRLDGSCYWTVIDSINIIDVSYAVYSYSSHSSHCPYFTIKSTPEIEKGQMWIWKLMDPYHKTNTEVRGQTEMLWDSTYYSIQYGSNIVLSRSTIPEWNGKFSVSNVCPWCPAKKSKIISSQRVLAHQDRKFYSLIQRVFVLFWPGFKFTDGSKSWGKYLVTQMTDWYWYTHTTPSHIFPTSLSNSAHILFCYQNNILGLWTNRENMTIKNTYFITLILRVSFPKFPLYSKIDSD